MRSEHPDLYALVYDAKRFILGNRWVIEHAPLQIYVSALVFSPTASKIKSLFQHHMPRWITQRPVVEQDWSPELSVLERHSGRINAVAVSPTDNLVVSVSYDGTTRLWDYITCTERLRLDGPNWYCCAAFSPDGRSIALGSNDGLVSVTEFGTGNVIDLEGHKDEVSHVVFSPKNNKTLASASWDITVRIWNVDERQTTHVFCFASKYEAPNVVEFTPDGRFLVVGGGESVAVWNVDNGECVRTFNDFNTSHAWKVAVCMDGKAAVISRRQNVFLLDLSTGKQKFEAFYDDPITSISLLPSDENFVLIGTTSGSIELRDLKTWSIVRQFHTSPNATCFALSRDGELLVSGGSDSTLRLWEMRSTAVGNKLPGKGFDKVYYLRFLSDDVLVINSSEGPSVWDATDGRMKSLPIDHADEIRSSPDGRYIVLGLEGGIYQLWNKSMTTQILKSNRLRNIVFSPDSNYMVLDSTDRGVRIVNSTTFQEMMTWETATFQNIEFSPNGQIVGLSKFDHKTKEYTFEFWNLPYRKRLFLTTSWTFVIFSPNSQVVAFRDSYEEPWKLLELVTGKEESVPGGRDLVFHPDSHLIAINDSDDYSHEGDLYITTYETASLESKHKLRIPGPNDQWCIFWSKTSPAIPTIGKLVTASSLGRNQTVKLRDTTTGLEIGRYTIEGMIDNLSFFDDRYLLCNQGRLPVPFALPDQNKTDSEEKQEGAQDCLFVGSQWVYQGLERILWLPPAYRSEFSVMRGQTLALVHERATVRIVKFNLTKTPVSTVRQSGVHLPT